MARSGRYHAPDRYGAWVGGEYYQPGQLLPEGTTEFNVRAIENISGTEHGWRTVSLLASADIDFEELEDEFELMFAELAEEYGIRF